MGRRMTFGDELACQGQEARAAELDAMRGGYVESDAEFDAQMAAEEAQETEQAKKDYVLDLLRAIRYVGGAFDVKHGGVIAEGQNYSAEITCWAFMNEWIVTAYRRVEITPTGLAFLEKETET